MAAEKFALDLDRRHRRAVCKTSISTTGAKARATTIVDHEMATSSLLLPSPASGQQSCCFFFHRHSSSRRLVRNERACTWKGPSGRVEPQGRFIGEPSSTSARPFGSRAQRRTARRRASIVGVFSSPESLGPPRRLLSPSADEAREAYNHGRAPAGAPRHSQDVRREELERLEPGRGCRARQVAGSFSTARRNF